MSAQAGKIKPSQRFQKENKMRILVTLIFSLMVFAPQSFAQKDDYSAINAKNCGLDVFYEVPGSTGVDTMREAYEKEWEGMVRRAYDRGQHTRQGEGKENPRWANMTEDEFVKVCRYERDEYRKKKKAKKGQPK